MASKYAWKFKEVYERKFDETLSSEKAEEYLEDLKELINLMKGNSNE